MSNIQEHICKLKFVSEGLEETKEGIEELSDALCDLPSQVTIRNCRNCTINVYPSQTRLVEVGMKGDDEDELS